MNIKYILILYLGLLVNLFAHEQVVHEAITTHAAASAYGNSPAYSSFINVVSSDVNLSAATINMVNGSFEEDDIAAREPIGGNRSYNHFYDPLDATYGKGLSDAPPDRRSVVGTNSFAWGSISNCVGYNYSGEFGIHKLGKNINTTNIYSWQNARGYEWLGLTSTNQSERQTNLLAMFRAVGQVMHLLEDSSQPQHVRNEQHFYPTNNWLYNTFDPWISPIEEYGKEHVNDLYYGDGSMLDWRGAGFTKLEDFWDRHQYNGVGSALDDDYWYGGTDTLGLAEWCNGNFLGDRHTYAEYFFQHNLDGSKNINWYPYPSLFTSTPYLQHGAFVDCVKLKNGQWRNRYYLPKTHDGIEVNHFSTISYFGAKFPNRIIKGATSIRDDNVLSDYHDAFIPKAVNYSAGLLDYFFRGTMSVSLNLATNNPYTFTNLNTSGQDFKGGSFYLFEETNGMRMLVQQYPYGGILPDGSSTNITYPGPAPSGTKFLIVYRGTIGLTGGSASDPVDANIGIAAARPAIEQTTTNNYLPLLTDIGLSPGSSMTNVLESPDFPFTLTAGNYEAVVNFAFFDDKGTIGSLPSTGPLGNCEGWPCEITNTVVPAGDLSISSDGKRLRVAITATDNADCGAEIGWTDVSITWRAWLPPQ